MLEKLRDILQCPECQNEIKIHPHEIVCQTCLKQFPIKNNVPLFSIEEIEKKGLITTPEKQILYNLKEKFPVLTLLPKLLKTPSLKYLTRGKDRLESYVKNIANNPEAIILDIGAGRKKYPETITLDLYHYPDIDLCANAEKLPLKDNSVDMVLNTSAMEHMVNIDKILTEMDRVLKSGGFIFVATPFVFPYHPQPFDLTRWSADGLKHLFPNYTCLESGSVRGPHATLHRVISSYFAWLFSLGNYPIYLFLYMVFSWVFLPLGILDALHGQYRQKQSPLDCIVYFIGQKP